MRRSIFLMCILVVLTLSCSNDKSTNPTVRVPTVATASITRVMQSTTLCGGEATTNGGATVTARGVCWTTDPSPKVADNKTTDGTGSGVFTSSITGLMAGNRYYVRAYATNRGDTGYGSLDSFSTAPTLYHLI